MPYSLPNASTRSGGTRDDICVSGLDGWPSDQRWDDVRPHRVEDVGGRAEIVSRHAHAGVLLGQHDPPAIRSSTGSGIGVSKARAGAEVTYSVTAGVPSMRRPPSPRPHQR